MENFILWNVRYDVEAKELCFFATSVQLQKINQGTEEMIDEMIKDLQLKGIYYKNWTIKHILTNYLMDYPPSDDWRDIWMDTWQIQISTEAKVSCQLKPLELIRSYAKDNTWKGEELLFPCECILLADFQNYDDLLATRKHLEIINNCIDEHLSISQIEILPNNRIIKYILDEITHNFSKQNKSNKNIIDVILSTKKDDSVYKLMISLGFFDEYFFAEGAKIGQKISELIEQFNGTTTWSETTNKLYIS